MVNERVCCCCGAHFQVRTQNPNQTYCSSAACQRARKRAWQRAKREVDDDYRENEARAQRVWRTTNPEYWRAWREKNPEYVKQNREAQRQRDRRRRASVDTSTLANGDASKPMQTMALSAGTYRIEPCLDACKCGRVTCANLFILQPIPMDVAASMLANENV